MKVLPAVVVLFLLILLYRHLRYRKIRDEIRKAYEAGYDDDTKIGDIVAGKTPHEVMVERMNKPNG
jgi:hypothetical protein